MSFPYRAHALGAAFVAALSLSAGAVQAQAPSEAQIKAAREVVELSGSSARLREFVPIIFDEAKRSITRTQPDLSKDLDAVSATLKPEFEKRREQLANDMATLYAQRFSVQELGEIKAFYETPTGAKFVKAQPGISDATYDLTQLWTQQMSRDVITRIREELKKKGREF